jgi:diaminopimelate epimerase
MQLITFHKYQGTGNDFIIIDNRNSGLILSENSVRFLCDRKFGIGADGLIMLEMRDIPYMLYYNSDGRISSMCGNGGRCFTAFASSLHLIATGEQFDFHAADGLHSATLASNGNVRLSMSDVKKPAQYKNAFIVDTGSPHYVEITSEEDLNSMNINERGAAIRNSEDFRSEGINVNFISFSEDGIRIRTYERGVEAETLSCGTGAVAGAIVDNLHNKRNISKVIAPGGELFVSFSETNSKYTDVLLEGPANFVFSGTINMNTN